MAFLPKQKPKEMSGKSVKSEKKESESMQEFEAKTSEKEIKTPKAETNMNKNLMLSKPPGSGKDTLNP